MLTKSRLRERSFIWLKKHSPAFREVSSGTQGKNWSSNDGGSCFLGCFLWLSQLQPRANCPMVAQPRVGWVLLDQALINKITHTHAHKTTRWKQFLNWGSLYSGDCNLNQGEIKNWTPHQILHNRNILCLDQRGEQHQIVHPSQSQRIKAKEDKLG